MASSLTLSEQSHGHCRESCLGRERTAQGVSWWWRQEGGLSVTATKEERGQVREIWVFSKLRAEVPQILNRKNCFRKIIVLNIWQRAKSYKERIYIFKVQGAKAMNRPFM